jgi:hypothetical protein
LYNKSGHNLLVLEWYDPISVGLGTYTIKGRELDYIQAKGLEGQLINLVPELDLMVVFTCRAGGSRHHGAFDDNLPGGFG